MSIMAIPANVKHYTFCMKVKNKSEKSKYECI